MEELRKTAVRIAGVWAETCVDLQIGKCKVRNVNLHWHIAYKIKIILLDL
jgi:hypothetical protein